MEASRRAELAAFSLVIALSVLAATVLTAAPVWIILQGAKRQAPELATEASSPMQISR